MLAVRAVFVRDMLHFWRERSRVFGFVASPLLFWLLLGAGFGDMGRFFNGSLLLSVMFTAVFSCMSVIEDRREGFLLSVLSAPAPRCALVSGKVLAGSVMSGIQGLLFLPLLIITGRPMTAGDILASAGALVLCGAAFTSLGFWMAWKSRTPQGFHAMMNLILMPLWLVSGALFDTSTAQRWIRVVMDLNPLSYFLAALQRTIPADPSWAGPQLGEGLLWTSICGILFLTAAVMNVERRPLGKDGL
jgi:ABC-2 type transport system permease protein